MSARIFGIAVGFKLRTTPETKIRGSVNYFISFYLTSTRWRDNNEMSLRGQAISWCRR
jgi:hypothetical protein